MVFRTIACKIYVSYPPVQWVLGIPTLQAKWLGCEADPSPPSSSKVKNAWSYTSTFLYVFTFSWCGT